MKPFNLIKRAYIWATGYSYTNLGRLFLRLFVGIILLHFALGQIRNFDVAGAAFPEVAGMSPETGLVTLIAIEIGCSVFIMAGFLMRLMIMPIFAAMVVAEYYLMEHVVEVPAWMLSWEQPGYVPFLLLGIFFFLLLVGPGKISVDYFLSLYILHSHNKSETALEEV